MAAAFGPFETGSTMRPAPGMAVAPVIPLLRSSPCPHKPAAEGAGGVAAGPACSGRCLMRCGKAITFLDH